MDYRSFTFHISPLTPFDDILVSDLADLGFESFVNTDDGLEAFVPADIELDILALINSYGDQVEITFTEKYIKDQNWNAEWEKEYAPVTVEDKCVVRAPFHEIDSEKYKLNILIQPQMSFGTGHHETTWLMLKTIIEMDFKEQEVLDMGSGTGVLAIAAKKLGAKKVWAIDIEEWAYQNTIENISLNDVQIDVDKGDVALIKGFQFDTILANINKNVLLSDIPFYANALKPGGSLIMSGFFTSDVEDIETCGVKNGMFHVSRNQKNDWATLYLKKGN